MKQVTVTAGGDQAGYARYLRRWVPKARAAAGSGLDELSVALVGAAKMARLHKEFMNISGPTDVLTFALEHGRRGRVTAGEIVICVPVARRAALRHGVTAEQELLLYALHGILHLRGYDDRTAKDFAKMHAEEDRILRAIGIGAVFNRQ